MSVASMNPDLSAGNADLLRIVQNPIDKKSRQVINQEVTVAQLGRTKVKDGGPFNESAATNAMQKHLRKKKKAYPVMFLVDRMRFKKKGYHEYLSYRQVEHFYQPTNNPDTFVLYIRDEKKNRKSYETYKCLNPEDVTRVKELIFMAGHDPKKILHEYPYGNRGSYYNFTPNTVYANNLNTLSRSNSLTDSTSSSEYYIERRPYSRLSRPRSVTQIPNYETHYYRPVQQPSPVVVYSRPTSRAPSVEPRIEPVRTTSVRQSNVYVPERQTFGTEDITYLRSDNIHGPQIMDNGPVYLYVSRSRPTSYRSNGDCDSPTYNYKSSYYH